jgi:hypothetical protein
MSRKIRTPRGYHPIVLVMPHSTLCSAVSARIPRWGLPSLRYGWNADRVPWDLTGRRNPRARHHWLVYPCKAPGCSAELAVWSVRAYEALGLDSAQWVGGRQE